MIGEPRTWPIRKALFAQDVYGHGCFLHSLHATAIFLDGVARAFHLACSCFTAQLCDQFEKLTDAGGAERVALRFEAARWIDRDASAQREIAALGGWSATTQWRESKVL